ncbi:MAG: hypothetical protein V1875_03755 [Candidatus Altiarchaeota archaeon]
MWVWLVALLLALSSTVSAASDYTCSQMPSSSCSKGTCPQGQACSYQMTISHPGGYCGCVATTTTTTQPSCAMNQKTGQCAGTCPQGSSCILKSYISHPGTYCGCGATTTSTTTTLRPCTQNPKSGACEGTCSKGLSCGSYFGKCACIAPTTTLRLMLPTITLPPIMISTTTTTQPRMQPPTVGDLVVRVTFPTTTTIRHVSGGSRLPDRDGDGVSDLTDNCVNVSNAEQIDIDYDGVGDVCDWCRCMTCGETPDPAYNYDQSDWRGCGCKDSDGGDNPYRKGTLAHDEEWDGAGAPPPTPSGTPTAGGTMMAGVTLAGMGAPIPSGSNDYRPTTYEDYCVSYNTLREYYCTPDGYNWTVRTCAERCRDGACLCGTTGDGNNQFMHNVSEGSYSDTCLNATHLREHYFTPSGTTCEHRNQTYECVLGCVWGDCLCGETDAGNQLMTRGTTALGHTDSCLSSSRIREYWISSEDPCTESHTDTNCPAGYACSEGACKPASCTNGVRDGDEAGADCGGTWCPPCSPCETGAKWAPTDGPCTRKWPTDQGPRIEGNTEMDSCSLYEVCDNSLDYIVEDALKCCENEDYESVLTGSRRDSKHLACNWARETSGLNADYNPTTYKKCRAIFAASAFGYAAVYMQGYFHGEWCCYDDTGICPDGCGSFGVNPPAWEMGSATNCRGEGGARPDFQMGGHRCAYNTFLWWKWGKAGYWSSDTNYESNSDSVVDVPAHASIDRLSTGTCVDYSVAMTTILRKMGYDRDSIYSVDGDGHWYNLIKLPGDAKWHYLDTVGNRGSEIMGGTGWPDINNQSDPARPSYGYDYCRKMDDGCSNDNYGESTGRCPSNNNIYNCEGIPR